MKNLLLDVLLYILGRKNAWRFSRSLYLKSRGYSPNSAKINGEELLQKQLIEKFADITEKLVVFDVGANIGDWTWNFLDVSSKSNTQQNFEIHAFEPVPSTFEALQDRITKHNLHEKVELISKALSNKEGTTDMYFFGDLAGTNSLHPGATKLEQNSIKINTTTLNNYCINNNIEIIHFLKCDTEGHDVEVINGAKKLFEEQRVMALQFEYNHTWVYSRHYLKDIFDLFKDSSYLVGKITPKYIELYKEWHQELERFFEGNYIILHKKALNWFRTSSGDFDKSNTFCSRELQGAKTN